MPREAHPTNQKVQTVEDLSHLFQEAKGIYLADFTGLNVEQVNDLRRTFFKQQVVYKVVKNTLIRHACENTGYQDLIQHLEGPTALAISLNDPVLPLRLITDFHKGKEKAIPVIKAGILEGQYVGSADVQKVKDIPSREVLLSQILSLLQSPLSGFLGTLNEVLRSFVAVLEAIIQKKGGAPPAAGEEPSSQTEPASAPNE
jgi:large subunit ribosomal protein L10